MDVNSEVIKEEELKILSLLKRREQGESVYELKKELNDTMEKHLRVFRNRKGMEEAREKIKELRERFDKVRLKDSSPYYNLELLAYFELRNMLDLAGAVVESALFREESRGPHYRTDFPQKDDKNWLKHTLVEMHGQEYHLSTESVRITHFKPNS